MGRDERLVGGYTGRMLLVAALAWAVIQLARFAIPPLLPEIRADLSLSLAQAGVVLTVLQGVYALVQYPSGRLSDGWSRATLLLPSFLVLAISSLLIGSATGFLLLIAGVAVFGFGKGLYAIPARALMSDLFVERRGRALGIFSAGTDLGGVLASGAAVVAVAVATWRAIFVPIAILLAALGLLFLVWNEEAYGFRRTDLKFIETARRLLATPRQRQALVAFILFYFMVNGVLNFLPEYLRATKGLSAELASAAFALLFAFGVVVKPASGAVSDRVPRQLVSIGGMILAMISLGLVLVVDSLLGIGVAIALFAIGYKAQFPVIDAILLDAAPDENMGGDLGAARALFLGVGSLGPAFVGYTADRFDFTVAFATLVVALILASIILARQGRYAVDRTPS